MAFLFGGILVCEDGASEIHFICFFAYYFIRVLIYRYGRNTFVLAEPWTQIGAFLCLCALQRTDQCPDAHLGRYLTDAVGLYHQ